jgi:hypothetical protein
MRPRTRGDGSILRKVTCSGMGMTSLSLTNDKDAAVPPVPLI